MDYAGLFRIKPNLYPLIDVRSSQRIEACNGTFEIPNHNSYPIQIPSIHRYHKLSSLAYASVLSFLLNDDDDYNLGITVRLNI